MFQVFPVSGILFLQAGNTGTISRPVAQTCCGARLLCPHRNVFNAPGAQCASYRPGLTGPINFLSLHVRRRSEGPLQRCLGLASHHQ